MTARKQSSSMDAKTIFRGLLGLLCVGIIFAARGAVASCSDRTFSSACICLDDPACVVMFDTQACDCAGGRDLSLQQLAAILRGTNGVVESLYLSGKRLRSLELLDGLLTEVRRNLVVLNTGIRSLGPLAGITVVGNNLPADASNMQSKDGLRSTTYGSGGLDIVGNAMLSDVDGLSSITLVDGHLTISGNAMLSNLDGLSSITWVNGSLAIEQNGMLSNVDGLSTTTRVNGDLLISNNTMLSNVDGLSRIAQVNGRLAIGNNGMLSNLDGLTSITQVNGNLIIFNNAMLSSVDGLSSTTQVNGNLVITDNDKLSDVDGLGSITQAKGDVLIEYNDILSSLDGLGSITQVIGHLKIMYNAILSDVDGLGNITWVNGSLWIWFNDMLSSVDGLSSITYVKGDLFIGRNGVLPNLNELGSITQVNGHLRIWNNSMLSNLDGLSGITQVKGDVAIELNGMLSNVDGLSGLVLLNGGLLIQENAKLTNLDGLSRLAQVNGSLVITENAMLADVGGLSNITRVNGNLQIYSNGVLSNVDGFSSIMQVDGNLMIQSNKALRNLDGLGNIEHVNGDLFLSKLSINPRNSSLFEKMVNISGSLTVENIEFHLPFSVLSPEVDYHNVFRRAELSFPNYSLLPGLAHIGGSLVLKGNRLLPLSFLSLQSVCSNAVERCNITIDDNAFQTESDGLSSFDNLSGPLKGGVYIRRNAGLTNIASFNKLTSLRGVEGTGQDQFLGGLVIAFNPDLETVNGFDILEKVEGDVEIHGNGVLDYISMKSLATVDGETSISSNGEGFVAFESKEALPYRQAGCRVWKGKVPISSAFVTRLAKNVCTVEVLTPMLVGFAIIGMLVLVSLLLMNYLALRFCSPYRKRMSLSKLKGMFATHLLALADVLSDAGFIVTVFILWDSKSRTGIAGSDDIYEMPHTPLFVIGCLSVVVLAVSQLFAVVAVLWGLKTIHADQYGSGESLSLMDYLKEEQCMRNDDWLLLLPGLLFLDVEILKHLPWGSSLTVNGIRIGENDEFPHPYFTWVAFIVGLLEDVPQMALQIAFIVRIEDDDGWAITGAMASLTLSAADAMVKIVFPLLIQRLVPDQRHITREFAMAKRCDVCDRPLPRTKLLSYRDLDE